MIDGRRPSTPAVRNLTRTRQVWDRVYGLLTAGAWPARLAWRIAPVPEIEVEQHEVTPAQGALPRDLRIVFASDFHAGPATAWPLIEKALEQVNRLEPDVVLFGGDFVSIDPAHGERLFERIGQLRAPLGRYAVLGNHDYWAGAHHVVRRLEAAGVELVTNRCVRLPAPFDCVSVSGLDDHTSGDIDSAAAAFERTGEVRVVLMHQPSSMELVGDRHFDVAFCGHTHGGQIALGRDRPLIVACGPLSRQYNAGRYAVDGRTLIVSRGVGCGTLPFRMNSPSSVVLCTVRATG